MSLVKEFADFILLYIRINKATGVAVCNSGCPVCVSRWFLFR
jgi:hypothetical protein